MNQDEVDDEEEEEDDDEINDETEMEKEILTADVMDDDRIMSALTESSDNYIIFTGEVKKYAITVYCTIKEVAEEQNHKFPS